jgi:fumarate reductase (CoM/CoB) subunit A
MAHYTLGGILIDPECRTRIGGLFAAGEVEANVHGANRLAGNALPEIQVFGAKAGEKAAHWASERVHMDCDRQEVEEEAGRIESFLKPEINSMSPAQLKAKLQGVMWRHVGIERTKEGLQGAIEAIARIKQQELPRLSVPPIRAFNLPWVEALEVSHMLDLADMITRAALMREETRGHHFRLDFPERDDEHWHKHIITRKEDGEMQLWTEQINEKGV